MKTETEKVIEGTLIGCDIIIRERPHYAEAAQEMKADLIKYPSIKLAEVTLRSLCEMHTNVYEMFPDTADI